MEMGVSTILVDILIGCFSLATLSWVLVGIETFINDHKREKRDQEAAKRDIEYHEKRMKDIFKK